MIRYEIRTKSFCNHLSFMQERVDSRIWGLRALRIHMRATPLATGTTNLDWCIFFIIRRILFTLSNPSAFHFFWVNTCLYVLNKIDVAISYNF